MICEPSRFWRGSYTVTTDREDAEFIIMDYSFRNRIVDEPVDLNASLGRKGFRTQPLNPRKRVLSPKAKRKKR